MRPATPGSRREQAGRLLLAAVLVTFLPQMPLGNLILYPFIILSTWFHEMGHGLAAILVGWDFHQLTIYPSGSGLAESYAVGEDSALNRAFVAAGGPLAPSLIGALLILASSRAQWWRPTLLGLAAIIALSVPVYVNGLIGWIMLPLIALGIGWIAWAGPDWAARFALQFLGMVAALSMFASWDYLFTEQAVIAGQVMPSDTGAIEAALHLPHWVWAIAIIVASIIMVGASLFYALRGAGSGRVR